MHQFKTLDQIQSHSEQATSSDSQIAEHEPAPGPVQLCTTDRPAVNQSNSEDLNDELSAAAVSSSFIPEIKTPDGKNNERAIRSSRGMVESVPLSSQLILKTQKA